MTIGNFFLALAVWFVISCLAAPLLGRLFASTNIREH